MTWAWDTPGGVYKDHFLSSKIRHAAVADSEIFRWLTPEPGFGKGQGDTVNITRFGNLPLAGIVSEEDRLPEGKPPVTLVSSTVSEYGYKVKMTELEKNLSHYNMRDPTQRALRDQMRLTMDKLAADAFKATVVKANANGTALQIQTSGSFGDTSDDQLEVTHLRELVDWMRGTQKIPPFKNGRYVGILSTNAIRGLKSDTNFATWFAPTTKQPMVTGMMPNIEGFDLYETNHFDSLDNTTGDGDITGEAIFFGADAAFLATADEPELRVGPKEDLGRFHDLGWVGTLSAGLTWTSTSQARCVHWK